MKLKNLDIGLVLSGGGHKGLAHAGALKFLEEQNIKPKIIAGTSAGSIVGSLYSCGVKPESILAFFKAVDFFSWNHFTFRKAGVLDSSSFRTYLEAIFKDKKIGDLPNELYITGTDMERGRLKIFDTQTRLLDAVLASSAFPGIISPVSVNGKLYSDGGILNNFPVTTVQGRCDFIIGINLCPVIEAQANQLTSIKSITLRAYDIMLMQSSGAYRELCDWYMEPKKLQEYSTFETKKTRMDEIFNIGYYEAKRTFENVKDKI
ncbi:patatin-like phospholipase family protein [Flavobacterium sp. I3-2]|uniref:patatin-like phospholipase family protein n=1 Tax=Flavobacterium sp. I3-2 TaxID=2748319 RepID=UPI0015AD904A|nr:patatin-like phospholipase family protein [Flavobacterium sp. I3-2]